MNDIEKFFQEPEYESDYDQYQRESAAPLVAALGRRPRRIPKAYRGRQPPRSHGAQLLRAVMDKHSYTVTQMAYELHTQNHSVNRILQQHLPPSLRSAMDMHRAFAIPYESWFEPPVADTP